MSKLSAEKIPQYQVPNVIPKLDVQQPESRNYLMTGAQECMQSAPQPTKTKDFCFCTGTPQGLPKPNLEIGKAKNIKEIELINKEEFEREEKIKILRLCKDDMYYHLLKPYKYTRFSEFDEKEQKEKYTYECKYEECNKVFTKAWNLLDHVRMHEGIKPYQCELCKR